MPQAGRGHLIGSWSWFLDGEQQGCLIPQLPWGMWRAPVGSLSSGQDSKTIQTVSTGVFHAVALSVLYLLCTFNVFRTVSMVQREQKILTTKFYLFMHILDRFRNNSKISCSKLSRAYCWMWRARETIQLKQNLLVRGKDHRFWNHRFVNTKILWLWSLDLFIQVAHMNLLTRWFLTRERFLTKEMNEQLSCEAKEAEILNPQHFLVRDHSIWLVEHIYFHLLLCLYACL